ncbi:putative ABC transport system permease protein [Algoriphagus boseongensis]|uniref:Putative ABC transport system permease protein n=1 Tax=Algoriphagus boseongensis TaxID=1442587 RepID=A0A4R6T9F8_9BACT|nr:FtsX-like permease family protein [Algoriphagus boseongensis]TDQ18502.1 putative ABC transport system permease protein [Algoriphagus boseongensis]
MWKNYLKISFRNLQKRKLYTGINLLGLTIALVSFIAISLYIHHEWSYDRMYSDYERIYKLNQEFTSEGQNQLVGTSPSSLPITLREEFPEVEKATLVFDLSIFSSVMIDAGAGNQEEKRYAMVDENFLDVFDFQLLAGQKGKLWDEPNKLVVTEETADRLFGNVSNAVGKVIKVDGQEFEITGVMQNFPSNSHMDFDFLASFQTHRHGKNPQWSPSNYYNYVKLREGTDVVAFESKMAQMVEKYLGADQKEYGFQTAFYTQPIAAVHTGDPTLNRIKPGTDLKYLYIFGVVAILLIAIGIINYVNLATAEATERNKEVGLRKVMGADRFQLFGQFVSESFILTLGALLVSLLVIYLLAPFLVNLGQVPLSLDLLASPLGIGFLIALALLVGLLAGLYPSLILSGMEPIKALGNKIKMGGGAWVRKSLVVFQFFVSMGLLISTFVVKAQLDFMKEVNLGYSKERLVAVSYPYESRSQMPTIKAELIRSGAAIQVAQAGDMPIHIKAGYKMFPGGDNQSEFMITGYSVDTDLINTIDLELVAGENFSESDIKRSDLEDGTEEFPIILNEAAIRQMGWNSEEAIGKHVNLGYMQNSLIKGVVKDFYFNSLHHEVGPLAIFNDPADASVLLIKIPEGDPSKHLSTLAGIWAKLVPGRPFNPVFVDSAYNNLYQSEQNSSAVFTLFSGIAILLALMGLFGLVSYVALRRTREISIRKVLGATGRDVLGVLAIDFMKLLGVSAILAIGFGLWFAQMWLKGFANQTEVGVTPFLISIGLVFTLAILTIGYRSWKVFRLNPAKTLKSE